jgi:hypothetical protein
MAESYRTFAAENHRSAYHFKLLIISISLIAAGLLPVARLLKLQSFTIQDSPLSKRDVTEAF